MADATPQFRIIDLGLGDNSTATAINDHGHVVGQRANGPFLWRNGRVTDLLPAGSIGQAEDINNRDEVVGWYFADGGVTHAFLWRRGEFTDLGTLPGGTVSLARAINDRGDIVGVSDTGGGAAHAFRWRAGVMTDLGTGPGEDSSTAADINRAGVVAGTTGAFNPVAVTWDRNGAIQPLTTLPTVAEAINDFGAVTGRITIGIFRGFLWHRGQFTEIPAPPGPAMPNLTPHGINNRTQVVGSANADAFLWQRGQMTILPSLVSTSVARDINDRGQIVGSSATTPDGLNEHAVLWTR